MNPILVDAREAAKLLGISARSFYLLRERAQLRPVRLSEKLVRYRVADVQALADGMASGDAPREPAALATPAARAKRAATLAARRTARPSKAPPGADSAPSPGVTRHRIPA